MKIAVIGDPNGIHLKKRMRAFIQEGFDIQIVTLNSSYTPENNIACFSPDPSQRLFKRYIDCALFFRQHAFDAIYIFCAGDPVGWLSAVFSSAPLVVATIGYDVFIHQQAHLPLSVRLNIKWIKKVATRLTTLSSHMRETLLKMNIPKERVMLDYWGLDPSWFESVNAQDLQKQRGLKESHPIIFSCRLMQPPYQIERIVEAVSLLKSDYPQLKLILSQYHADSLYQEKIRTLIKSKNLEEAVVFLDPHTSDSIFQKVYALADLVVMIPLSDGMPSSLLESWASRKPAVVSDIPHYDEAWHNTLVIKTATDVQALAATMRRVLEDQELYKKLVKNGWAYASHHYKGFSVNKVLSTLPLTPSSYFKRGVGGCLFLFYLMDIYWEELRKRWK